MRLLLLTVVLRQELHRLVIYDLAYICIMKAIRNRSTEKGTFSVEVDGKEFQVKGAKVVKQKGGKTVIKFKAKGIGEGNPVKRINDKLVKKDGLVKKNKKKTTFKKL